VLHSARRSVTQYAVADVPEEQRSKSFKNVDVLTPGHEGAAVLRNAGNDLPMTQRHISEE
jgi:hypothetical protein